MGYTSPLYVFREMAEVRGLILALYLPLRDLATFRFRVKEPLLGLGGVWFVRRRFINPILSYPANRHPGIPASRSGRPFSAANDVIQDDDNCEYQKNVNETAHGVGSNEAQEPQDYKYYDDSPKHDSVLSCVVKGKRKLAMEKEADCAFFSPSRNMKS
jgi:hypothetical protein